jgi:hypothetical protein
VAAAPSARRVRLVLDRTGGDGGVDVEHRGGGFGEGRDRVLVRDVDRRRRVERVARLLRRGPECLGPLRLEPLRLGPLRLGPLRLGPLRLGPLRLGPPLGEQPFDLRAFGGESCRLRAPVLQLALDLGALARERVECVVGAALRLAAVPRATEQSRSGVRRLVGYVGFLGHATQHDVRMGRDRCGGLGVLAGRLRDGARAPRPSRAQPARRRRLARGFGRRFGPRPVRLVDGFGRPGVGAGVSGFSGACPRAGRPDPAPAGPRRRRLR